MVQPGIDGLDTPRTNVGDATYLGREPDFDITQEPSFQSPSKDANIFQQLRNGGRPNLKTPRGSRAPFADRRNLPRALGGAEFTPLLKSAARNTTRRMPGGKENGLATPAFLAKIDEDMSPVPIGESSVYGASRNASSYMSNTPVAAVDSDSTTTTPLVMRKRGGDSKGPLQDGNQLSLREQENVIDRIEKENFGLKLKIHFLEEALRKAGPGFSEAALKENTELKVDKVTMQRELQRYKKHLTSAEKDLESYRQQILEVQEKAKRKFADESQRAEMERLRRELETKEADVEDLRRKLDDREREQEDLDKLRDKIQDLETDLRQKDHIIVRNEDEIEDLRDKALEAEREAKEAQRRMVELEEKASSKEELEDAHETIRELETNVRDLEQQADRANEQLREAVAAKTRAEGDLGELQEEMANKSVMTKGLSRKVEEKMTRLRTDLEDARQECTALEERCASQQRESENLKAQMNTLRQERDTSEHMRQSLATKLKEAKAELHSRNDEKALLQTQCDTLTSQSASLQHDVTQLRKSVAELEDKLEEERGHALDMERGIQAQYKDEIDRLQDEIADLQAECREKDNLYDNDSEKWDDEKQALESEKRRAEERAEGLQLTIDMLRETQGTLSDQESRLQEAARLEMDRHRSEVAVLDGQMAELRSALDAKQATIEDLRNKLAGAQEELRRSQLDCQAQTAKVEALEDEVEVLQATLDDEAERAQFELDEARRECDALREHVKSLQEAADSAQASRSASLESERSHNDALARMSSQLEDAAEKLAVVMDEKQTLQNQLSRVQIELRSLQEASGEIRAERDALEDEIRHLRRQGEDNVRTDQERLDLRTAKAKLEGELRRLRDENKGLADQRAAVEKSLEDELEKAAVEEQRLNQEIFQLQIKMRQPSENQDLSSARRRIRELERRIEEYETRLATRRVPHDHDAALEGNSELSLLQRDLASARQNEVELLQREASQKDTIKSLRKQVAELERRAHEATLDKWVVSPSSQGGSAQKAEVVELRHQLTAAHQSAHELKRAMRDAEHKANTTARELLDRLDELEEDKVSLEQALEDAQLAAEEAAATVESTIKKCKLKMEKYKAERDDMAAAMRAQAQQQRRTGSHDNSASSLSLEERRDLHAMLRESQLEADKLSRRVREQSEALDELRQVELSLRNNLDRARSERAAYRASAERLQKDVKALEKAKDKAKQAAEAEASKAMVVVRDQQGGDLMLFHSRQRGQRDMQVDTDAIIRAAEAAERRHEKEIRGVVMHMEWLKANWDRESKMRSDAAFAKKYLLLELQIRDACNKADLALLDRIRGELNPNSRSVLGQLSLARQPSRITGGNPARGKQVTASSEKRPFTIQRLLTVVRFVVRMRLGARDWAEKERLRQRLADRVDEMEREARIKEKREQWRAHV